MKGAVESVLRDMNIQNVRFIPCKSNPSYHPGRCAQVYCQDKLLGYAGQIHPVVLDNYDIGAETYVAELDMGVMYSLVSAQSESHPLPKYPAVTRDLALVCDEEITVAQVEDVINASAGNLLRGIRLFDIYRGVGIADGKKSMAFSLELRADDRTLNDQDSEAVVTKVLAALKEKLNATLR